jgi:3-oxoacyl-[acyl-carrier protein] reductase
MGLSGKVAIVTGASRGIGRATARKLAEEGATVVVNYLKHEENARRLVEEMGRGIAVQADVRDPRAVAALVQRTLGELQRIDILINNAHEAYRGKPFEECDWADFQRELDTLIRGTFQTCQAVLPAMKRQGSGTIINIGSTMTHHIIAGHSMYITAKSALVGLTKALAFELGHYGIRVNLVTPGPVDTDHNAELPKSLMEKLARETPLYGRVAVPEDIAKAIVLMTHDDASFITGADLLVCAGHTIV